MSAYVKERSVCCCKFYKHYYDCQSGLCWYTTEKPLLYKHALRCDLVLLRSIYNFEMIIVLKVWIYKGDID